MQCFKALVVCASPLLFFQASTFVVVCLPLMDCVLFSLQPRTPSTRARWLSAAAYQVSDLITPSWA
jgi:hypothetical protein